jgi:predicted transcriptional regulator
MIKEFQSKQESDIIGRYIKKLAQGLSEQDALILKYLYDVAKQNESKSSTVFAKISGDTVNSISNVTNTESFAVRLSLMKLEDKCFISKRRKGHFLKYEITDDGAYALNYLMNSTNFPGRKEKFDALLSDNNKGGYIKC